MHPSRFSDDLLPVSRQRAMDSIRRKLNPRLPVPLTRGDRGAARQFGVKSTRLDLPCKFCQAGVESSQDTGAWMRAFSEILRRPPEVAILRVDESRAA